MRTITVISCILAFTLGYTQEKPVNELKVLPVWTPVETQFIIDGTPESDAAFEKLKEKDIISITILKHSQFNYMFCYGPRQDVIIVKTKNGLKKRERKKLKQINKEKDKTIL